MNKKFTKLMAALALLTFLAVPMGMWGQTTTLVSGSGTSGYSIPEGWTKSGTVEGGQYLKFDDGTITSPQFEPHNELSFSYSVATFGSGTNHPLTIRILNASTNAVILEQTTVTPTSSSYTSPESPLSLGDVTVAFKIQMYGPTGRGVRLRNYSVTGTPASGGTTYTVSFNAGAGTFVGNTDFPNASNTVAAGTYTLPSATPATGYTFDGWVATGITTPITGSYTVSGAVAFTAHYTQSTSGTATYTITSTSAVSVSGQAPSGSSATFSQTYSTKFQMTSGHSMTLTLSGYQGKVVTGITLNMRSNASGGAGWMYAKAGNNTLAFIGSDNNGVAFNNDQWNGSYTTSYTDVTIGMTDDGYAIQNDENLVIFIKATQNSLYCQSFTITYESASSITRPQFSPAGGIYTSAQNVTISGETGATIYYTTDGSQPTTNSTPYNGAISIESTTTLKAIAVVNGESSNVASATYTILNPLTTMQAIFDNATATPASHEVAITFGNWVISGQNGSQTTGSGANRAWLTDNDGKGCLIYDSNNPNLMAGNVLNGTVICNLQLYNGSAQITGVNSATTDINGNTIVSTGGNITPVETTIGNLSGISTGAVVKLNHLRCISASTTSNTLTDGTNTIYAKKTLYSSLSFAQGKIYDLTGVFEYSSSTSTIYPRSAADVVEAPKATLTIGNLANVTGLNVFYSYDEINPIISEGQSSDQQQVYVGEEITVSPEVAAHCVMQSLIVTDGDDNPVTVTDHMTDGGYYSFIMPSSGATITATANVSQKYTLTVVGDHVNITQLLVGEESEVVNLDANNQASIYEQAEVLIDGITVDAAYMIESVTIEYGDTSVEVTKNSGGLYAFTMPSSIATLTFTVGVKPTYTLVTSEDQLVPGKHYIIVGSRTASGSTKHYAMGLQNQNNRKAVEVTISNNTVEAVDGIYEFVISGPETINKDDQNVIVYTIFDVKESGYLCATSSSDNYLKTESDLNNNGKWAIAIGATTHVATITAQGDKTRNKLKKNSSSDIFSCYGSGQNDVYLYVKDGDNNCHIYSNTNLSSDMTVTGDMNIHAGVVTVKEDAALTVNGTLTNNGTAANLIIEDGGQLISNSAVYATVLKNIDGYSNGGGWNFVASPIFSENGLNPSTVGMITTESDYDLYRFNPNVAADAQGVTKEWENYKVQAHQNDFMLYNGHGYLYANEEDVILQFSGVVNSPDAVVSYDYDENSESELKDWHLVGNPYMYEAYPNMSYYVVSGSGIAEPEINGAVAPCEGIMIQGTNGLVNFTRTPENATQPSNLQMTLAQQVINRGTVSSTKLDKAIISFNEGSQLGKFYLGESTANIYIPQANEEYAIVSAEAQGEMPVNFRATKNGTYTLTINPEGVEMNYLHLIDNMTGIDIDLLQTPNYTFESRTTDYTSRFRLVFGANGASADSDSDETFAYFNGSEWMINNSGNATLQVVDVMGRVLSSEAVNGSVSKAINAPAGVYMLRLINGNDMKTQKIVVR